MTRRANDKRTRRYKAVRYAVIGLGHIAQAAVLPAFRLAQRNSRLAALVSGEMKKLRELGRRHGVERLCGYDGVDEGGGEQYSAGTREGGGPLYDIGIYCINAARYCLSEEH